MPLAVLLKRVGTFLLKRGVSAASSVTSSVANQVNESITRALNSQTVPQTEQKEKISLSRILEKPHHTKDDSFWASLLTILFIPILLLVALFEIVLKANPWASGL